MLVVRMRGEALRLRAVDKWRELEGAARRARAASLTLDTARRRFILGQLSVNVAMLQM